MRGTILGVDGARGVLIAGDARLEFALSEWRSAGAPAPGQAVDFLEEGGAARAVFAVPSQSGATQSGAFIMAAVALGSLVLGLIVPLVPTLVALVLGLIAAGQARAERQESALVMARIAWIGATVLLIVGLLMLTALILLFGGLAAFAIDLKPLAQF